MELEGRQVKCREENARDRFLEVPSRRVVGKEAAHGLSQGRFDTVATHVSHDEAQAAAWQLEGVGPVTSDRPVPGRDIPGGHLETLHLWQAGGQEAR
ncbi:MAG: hypothetical protein ACYDGN_16435 [Acidimicrobiales bacterium]